MSFNINGLASGLDTGQIISDMMKLERAPYTRLETKKTNLQSEQNIFRSINTKLSKLQTTSADLKLSSTFNLTSAQSTNETAVKVSAKEGASAGSYRIAVKELAQSHSMASSARMADLAPQALSNKTFTVNGNNILVPEGLSNDDALEYVKDEINKTNSGVSASIVRTDESGNKALTLSSTKPGAAHVITWGGDGFAELNMLNTQAAADARMEINGVEVTRSSNRMSDVIPGVTLDLLQRDEASTVTIAPDGDKIASKVEAFVAAYNEVVTMVRDNLVKPTDKSKMNPLQGDAMLKQIYNNLNNIFSDIHGADPGLVRGDLNPDGTNKNVIQMSQLGLEIDKGITSAALMTGKITFDKEAFKAKLIDNTAAAAHLFIAKDEGFADKINKQLKEWTSTVDGLMTSKIKGYDAEIEMVDERLVALDNRLLLKEKQMKRQFTAMEVTLNALKNQQSWLTNQLAALTPKK